MKQANKGRAGTPCSLERSAWTHLWLSLVAPGRVMEALRDRWAWFPAYVGSAVSLTSISLITLAHVRPNLEDLASNRLVPTDVLIQATRISLVVMPIAAPILQGFLAGAALKLLSYFVDIRCRFSKLYAIAMWAAFPAHLMTTLFNGLLMVLLPVERWPGISFSLAVPLPTGTWAWKVAKFLDLPNLYMFYALWLGVATVHKRTFRLTAPMMVSFLSIWMAVATLLLY